MDAKINFDEGKWMVRWGRHNSTLAKIVGETKTQWKLDVIGGREVRATKRTGKEVGSYDSYWRICDDPAKVWADNEARKAKAHAEAEAREVAYEERLEAVKVANPNRELVPFKLGVKVLDFVDKNGKPGFAMLQVEKTQIYDWEEHEMVYGWRVSSAQVFSSRWDDSLPTWSSPGGPTEAKELDELLVKIIARYWD